MPVSLTYPGVYIEEIPSGVRTITGVATSIAAFIDCFKKGPTDKAVQVLNFGDFEREFGGLCKRSEASYAIQQFFLNGGKEAWVSRVTHSDAIKAKVEIDKDIANMGNKPVLTISALSEGEWGNNLRVKIDFYTQKDNEFNATITEYDSNRGRAFISRQETFRNLSMDKNEINFVEKVVNDPNTGSKLIRLEADKQATSPPLTNGTISDKHNTDPNIPQSPCKIKVIIGKDKTTSKNVAATAELTFPKPGDVPLMDIAPILETAIRSAKPENPAFSRAVVNVVHGRLHIMAGSDDPENRAVFENIGGDTTADNLKLTNGAKVNFQEYRLGEYSTSAGSSALINSSEGNDGSLPDSTDLIGNRIGKKGIYMLEDVDQFNLLCIPFIANFEDTAKANAVVSVAESYCKERQAFFIMDTPVGIDERQKIKNWINSNSTLRDRNVALYYPRVKIPDPLDEYRLRSFGASGTIAGLYARTDSERGVWKAPAGIDAKLINVYELEDILTDDENGTLNPLAINCLRNFPLYGNICWGARTLDGADQIGSEWKYIPVRRTALFLEESLYRGLKWVVFEPNDEPLWAQIRLNVGAFMHSLFRQHAFQGMTPREAYFVKCDKETTTQDDINKGIVNIVVGFAPLKPAEFVVIKIQQMAGQIQT